MKNRTILGLVCIGLALALAFGIAPFVNKFSDSRTEVLRVKQTVTQGHKSVVNNVVFPVIDLILAVLFFAKLSMTYMEYRKHGQFEWSGPAILFATLVFSLTAPLYIWGIIGM